MVFEERGGGGSKGENQQQTQATSHIFSIYKNVVFPAQAKNYYFILLLG